MLYELRNIAQVFKDKRVLDIPDLEIEAGKIYTLIGPNGAGKTTLLNVLALLEKPSEGRLWFSGQEVSYGSQSLLEQRRRVVLVDQYPILFTGPVWKNVEFGLKVRKLPAAKRKEKVEEMLDLVGMSSFINEDAHKLSGGETKRIALARALAIDPDVLLCDEPGANVDRENQEIILNILQRINQTKKTSILFSTHYLSQGRRLADHSLMLEHGSLSDMVNENIFRATVVQREEAGWLCQLQGRLMVNLPHPVVPESGRDFKLHVDPDQVRLLEEHQIQEGGPVVTGHVIHINQDRGRVRVGIHSGVTLYFFMPLAEYLKKPPVIGAKLSVQLLDGGLRSTPL